MNKELLALPLIAGYVIIIFFSFLLRIRGRIAGNLFLPIKYFLALFLAMVLLTFILC